MSTIRGFRCGGVVPSKFGPRTCSEPIEKPGLCSDCRSKVKIGMEKCEGCDKEAELFQGLCAWCNARMPK